MQPASQAEAERLLGLAEKLLEEKDLNAARDFALLAQETEPLLDGSDRILAIADVLIAANKQINDWYGILQIENHQINDLNLIKQQYRRLAILLHPDNNKFSSAGSAFNLVGDAWSVLSDPVKKSAYDQELIDYNLKNQRENEIQNPREKMPVRRKEVPSPSPLTENIWTPCPYCYNLYEYPRVLEGCCLRCANCDRAFQVVAIPPELMPVTVPGKEAYYCSRPCFPIGFMNLNSETGKTSTTVPAAESGEVFVDGASPELQKKAGSTIAGDTVSRKRGRPVRNPAT